MKTFIVSGFPRSGTSMVMRALQAGGIDLVYSGIRDSQMNDAMSDENYRPNPESLYEIPMPVQNHPGFPQAYFGKSLKVLLTPFGSATSMWPGEYVIIIMRRDYEEVRQSYEAFFALRGSKWPFRSREVHEAVFQSGVDLLQLRNDAEVHIWDYPDVIDGPLPYFARLFDTREANAAAGVVKSELYRFKRELLTEGV